MGQTSNQPKKPSCFSLVGEGDGFGFWDGFGFFTKFSFRSKLQFCVSTACKKVLCTEQWSWEQVQWWQRNYICLWHMTAICWQFVHYVVPLAISSLSVSPCHSSLKICWSFWQWSYCFISYQPGDETTTRFVVSLPIFFLVSLMTIMWVGCRHFVQDSKPHGPVCMWASSHKLCTRLCLSNVQDSQTCCLRVYTRLWNSTLDKCVMQRDLQMGACACSCQALPTFCFPLFVFSYNMLQHAHPDQWAMKYIYI